MKTKKQKPVEIKLNLPKWMKWVAKDEDNGIYGYTIRPSSFITQWGSLKGKVLRLNEFTDIKISGDWRKSLRCVVDGKLVMP